MELNEGLKVLRDLKLKFLVLIYFLKTQMNYFVLNKFIKKCFSIQIFHGFFFFFFTFFPSFTPFLFLVLPCGPVSMKSSGALTND